MKSLWKYFYVVSFVLKKIYKMKFGIFVEFALGHIWQ